MQITLLVAVLLAAGLFVALELMLHQRGYVPTVVDSARLWSANRLRASELGDRALILVGASRMQLDIDLPILAQQSGLVPVQLAIDGSSFLPVLQNLVDDPDVSGTILVDAGASKLIADGQRDRADEWVGFYQDKFRHYFSPRAEVVLQKVLFETSAVFSLGIPLKSIPERLFGVRSDEPQYLITHGSRQRDADYRKVDADTQYFRRVAHDFGPGLGVREFSSLDEFSVFLREQLRDTPTRDPLEFRQRLQQVLSLAERYRDRGGKMAFVRMPSSRLIWEIAEHRTPRAQFWDRFADLSPVPTFHFLDYPAMGGVPLPDGSHVDVRNKVRFTREFARMLKDAAVLYRESIFLGPPLPVGEGRDEGAH